MDDAMQLHTDVRTGGPVLQRISPPGPGTWILDAGHAPRPLCRFSAAVLPSPFMAGFRETFARYGVLLEANDVAVVRGFLYNRIRAVGAPPEAAGPPPECCRTDRSRRGTPTTPRRGAGTDPLSPR